MIRLPPLKSLHAFESAGRLQSFTRAAAELSVTPGAISQQIRILEDFLELRLFKRMNRAIELTEAGRLFLPMVSSGFEQLGEAVEMLRQTRSEGPLTVTSAPSFISKWLIPRLGKFRASKPRIDVRIDASERLVDFMHEDIDVGIRFGDGEYPELESVFLFSFDIIPVCSPELMQRGDGLRQASDLKSHILLHNTYYETESGWPNWSMWLAVAGVADVDTDHGIYFSDTDLMFQAALGGQGVALAPSALAEPEIEAGRLVQPFETRLSMPVNLKYYLVTSPQKARLPKVAAFREWILEESAYLRSESDQAGI